ncbi:lysophospholipid acyltransferase family protein [Spirosoma sp. KNUC1025]|uniref:lysophospholipid acyltransferase family protein n=1 Tax=Spirosoma sp. KNUC1025 TaxID=2894082 RepID=UPI0038674986|nr:lysophospholipid acyltransferase family protein [Spirosoma sp. KNUC1025]
MRFLSASWGSCQLSLAKACSYLVFLVLRYGLNYRYDTIYRNLKSSFPLKSETQIRGLLETYYRHLSDLCIEPFLLAAASDKLRNKLARYTNLDLLDQLYRERKQVVMLTSHYGNWEYLIDLPTHVRYPVYSAYSPPQSAFFDRILLALRKRFGVELIPQKTFYRQALALLDQSQEPKLVVLIADQRPGPASLKHHLSFLRQETFVQLGAERLARQARTAVVVVDTQKVGRFTYQYRFMQVCDNAYFTNAMDITQQYYTALEGQIRRSPAYWLWSHDRWKHPVLSPVSAKDLTA